MNRKRNLIFDLGNVLVGYRWKGMLTDDFGVEEKHAEKIGHTMFEDPVWTDYDLGLIDTEGLIEHYCSILPGDRDTIERMIRESERMLIKRERLWEKIEELKEQGYRLYILSNYSGYLFNKHTALIPFMDKLDGKVVSYEYHKIKPDPEIYQIILEKYDLDPKECIFFDDLKDNVEAAIEMGIDAVQVTSEDMLIAELDRL